MPRNIRLGFFAVVIALGFGCAETNKNTIESQNCSDDWFSLVETKVTTGDGQGHGPDLGSLEWRSVVEFQLGIRGNPEVPRAESEQWCHYINEHLIKLDAQPARQPKKAIPDRAGTRDAGALGDSSVTGSAAPPYTINGNRVQPGERGADGKVSLLASVTGDLNGDGRDDRAVILVLNSVGSGVFYYLNVFLDDPKSKWRFVGEEFLGDRIKFDFLEIYAEGSASSITGVPIHPLDYGQLVVTFSARSNEQSFTEEPSLYLTRHWKVKNEGLVLMEDY